jgi:membrane-bound lytic murein transglycosylase A
MGQPLTPLRSIAIDRDLFPLGALCYVETPLAQVTADGTISGWQRHRGFALAQDTGGAIKGPGRVDLFMGNGRQAETAAGHLKHSGGTLLFCPQHRFGSVNSIRPLFRNPFPLFHLMKALDMG